MLTPFRNARPFAVPLWTCLVFVMTTAPVTVVGQTPSPTSASGAGNAVQQTAETVTTAEPAKTGEAAESAAASDQATNAAAKASPTDNAKTQSGTDASNAPGSDPNGDWVVIERRPGDGEQCLVCGMTIKGSEIVEIRYRGRRFYIKAGDMFDTFAAQPEKYFRNMQAHSSLFDESAVVPRSMNDGWLYFGLYVVAGLICGAITGYVAIGKAMPALPWFFAGFFGNIAGLVTVFVVKPGDMSAMPEGSPHGFSKVAATKSPIACDGCGAMNHPSATECSACGKTLTPQTTSEASRAATG